MKKLFFIAAAFACSLCSWAQPASSPIEEIQVRKFIVALQCINRLYVESVDNNKVIEDAVKGMIEGLDPHSSYTTAKDVEALNEPLNGSFEGIGVSYNINEDTLVVIQPVIGGPSEAVGIMSGDKIVTVNDTSIAGVKMTKTEIMRRLRGPKGSKVNLGVLRNGDKKLRSFVVIRDKIPVHTVDCYYMIDENSGYVRITSFGQATYDEFMKAVSYLQKLGMKNIVIDLQGNGGGYLQTAVKIADEFFDNNELIVYTDGRAFGRQDYRATKGKLDIDKVVILVDGTSASASEILSGAIQDNDRGTIVGRRTFAKGLVQRAIPLPDGSEIRLTVAHYYSPVGRCFQKPYVKGDKKSYDKDLFDRLRSGELMNIDSIHFPDSLKFKTKGGKIVYGGGGVMPDVYVPLDTTRFTLFNRELIAKNCFIETTLKYLDSNRKSLIKKYNIESYNKTKAKFVSCKDVVIDISGFINYKNSYEVPQELIDLLLDKAKEAKLTYTDSVLNKSLPMIKLQLKALLARDLWDMNEYFQIINPTSEIYLSGIKALKEEK
ncbi:MAG: S41 family peptidase [Bacteroidaceae bacterium]|nr:S41 family peptidase [Bacteroidaceae bacterium]